MPRIPLSVWAKIGEYGMYALDAYIARRRASNPAQVPQVPVSIPEPASPVAPQSAPVLTREQKYRDRVDDIYVSILGRPTNTESERYEAYLLLEDGREDELRKNLNGRK